MPREPTRHTDDATGLSIVVGGPLYRACMRARLLRPQVDLPERRVLAVLLIAWVPLAVLSIVEGHAFSGVAVPFFTQLTAQTRYLIALPLLVIAEVVVHHRIVAAVGEFTDRGIIAPEDRPRFEQIIAAAVRLRDSRWVEAILVLLAYTVGYWLWKRYVAMHTTTWYAAGGYDTPLTAAGYWHIFISMPLFRFLMMRWYFRLLVWYWFLWRVSRLPLHLNALHPDRAGGLGFLNLAAFSFSPFLLAQTVLTAGKIGDRILQQGAALPHFRLEIVSIIVGLMLLTYLPLLFFTFHVARTRRAGHREFGAFAARYVDAFRAKWIAPEPATPTAPDALPGPAALRESPLGTSDIQSLADLSNSYNIIREMGATPIEPRVAARLAILITLPLTPLILTMIPLDELIERLLRLLI